MERRAMNQSKSAEGAPSWYTEIHLDLRNSWTDSTIAYVPSFSYDDSSFTRIEIETNPTRFTPRPTLGG
jgi:hypothetical protein